MGGVVGNVLVGVLSCIEKEQSSINEGLLERTNGI
jgi:hypothetical protein